MSVSMNLKYSYARLIASWYICNLSFYESVNELEMINDSILVNILDLFIFDISQLNDVCSWDEKESITDICKAILMIYIE